MRRRLTAVLVGLAAVGVSGCGGGTGVTSLPGQCAALEIVVTTSILGDVVEQVAADGARVEVLMPRGADPHSFQVSARQAAAMHRADLVVVNGLGLEEGMSVAIEAAAADGVSVLEAAAFVDALPLASGSGASGPTGTDGGGEGGSRGTLDPHIWTDPVRMADVVTGLGEALAGADPGCAERRRAAAAGYRQELLSLDAEMEGILAVVPADRRKLVTNHRVLGYFADRYGFEVLGAIIPGGDTLAEPSPSDLASLVEVLRRAGVRVIFAETTRPANLAEAVAAELGEDVTVVDLFTESLGVPGSGAETYVAMQRTNAERIAAALGGS